MAAPIDVDDIPGPRGVPFLGNVFDIDSHSPVEGLVQMARQYGPIYKVSVPAGTRLMISDPDLVNEICDDARFDKKISAGLAVLSQSLAGRGLFTSETSDPLWQRAHNILMAPFSLQAMRDYIPRMLDIANQLTDKWTRLNPGDEVDVPASMTALTLDTIALCGFDYRFNSFYRDTPPPVRRGYGPLSAHCAGPRPSPARSKSATDPRAAAARRRPNVYEGPCRQAHLRTPPAGRRS